MTNTSGQKEIEDTKVVIIIRISKKNRQHKGQTKKYYLFLAILRARARSLAKKGMYFVKFNNNNKRNVSV